jgi:hypothetical protein
MEAKKNRVVATKKGRGSVKDHRAASSGGSSDRPRVTKLTKAKDQRAKPSATNPAINKAAQSNSILGLVLGINRMARSPWRS